MWGCMSEPDSFFACIDDRVRWNDALDDGRGLSPRYVLQSSYQINGGNEVPAGYPEFFKARNPDEARELANYYADSGADFLKSYSEISAESYAAMAEEAGRLGLTVQGHRPLGVSLSAALSAGQKSIEHARLFLFECHPAANEFRDLADPLAAYTLTFRASLVDEHDEAHCKQAMAAMADSDTWWTPTLLTMKMGARAGDPDYRNDVRLKYVPYLFKTLMWNPDADRKVADREALSGRPIYDDMYRLAMRNVGDAHGAGVKMLVGTDVFDTYVFPGFSVHDELEELVTAGLSPLAAIQAATINAAVFSDMADEYGSISVGKRADMILLAENPLLDIRDTRRIKGVFFNGQYFDRSALDGLLDFAEQRAHSFHNNAHVLWSAINSSLLRVQFAD